MPEIRIITPLVLSCNLERILSQYFRANPYNLEKDIIEHHGIRVIDPPRTFEGLREYLAKNYIEGIITCIYQKELH